LGTPANPYVNNTSGRLRGVGLLTRIRQLARPRPAPDPRGIGRIEVGAHSYGFSNVLTWQSTDVVKQLLTIAWWDWPDEKVVRCIDDFYGSIEDFLAKHR